MKSFDELINTTIDVLEEKKALIKKKKAGEAGIQKRVTTDKKGYKMVKKKGAKAGSKKPSDYVEVKMSAQEKMKRSKGAKRGGKKSKAARKKKAERTRALNN